MDTCLYCLLINVILWWPYTKHYFLIICRWWVIISTKLKIIINSIVWLLFMIKGQFTYLINPNICITRWQWRWQLYKKHFKIFLLCTTFQACFCLLLFTLTGISQQFLLTFPVQGQVPAQLISRLTSFPVSTNALNHFTWSMISPHWHIHIHNKNISF